jgi:hypothetical protein
MRPSKHPDAVGETADPREKAAYHAAEAERQLKSWWLSTHVQAQVHATLAVYYSGLSD